MNRYRTTAVLAGIVIVLGLVAGCGQSPSERSGGEETGRPNILLIVVDTLRADHLSLYGYGRKTSPRIDELAKTSLVYKNAFTVMSHTLPAHVSMMTGLHPATHQVLSNDWTYEGKSPLLAERLHGAGYATGAFVSGFPLRKGSGIARGFETYVDTGMAHGEMREKVDGERTTRKALEWIESERDKPFFLFIHYFDTHNDYTTPPRGVAFEVDSTLRAHMEEIGVSGLSVEDVSPIPLHLDGRRLDLVSLINNYDNQIRRVDGLIGDLLAGLDPVGVSDETLLIITSDHGEGLGQHRYFSHGANLYEEQIRIPLMLRPNKSMKVEPAFVESAVSLLDIAPTILDAAGLTYEGIHGSNLQSEVRRSPARDPRWLLIQRRYFSESSRGVFGQNFAPRFPLNVVRGDGALKYLREGDGSEELYNLTDDPREMRNIAQGRREDVERMNGLMETLLKSRSLGTPPVVPPVDENVRKKLKSLGYIQ